MTDAYLLNLCTPLLQSNVHSALANVRPVAALGPLLQVHCPSTAGDPGTEDAPLIHGLCDRVPEEGVAVDANTGHSSAICRPGGWHSTKDELDRPSAADRG